MIDKVAYVSANMATEESDGNMQSYSWADVEVAEVSTGFGYHCSVFFQNAECVLYVHHAAAAGTPPAYAAIYRCAVVQR